MFTDIVTHVGGGDTLDKQTSIKVTIVRLSSILSEVAISQQVARRYIRPLLVGSVICGYLNGVFLRWLRATFGNANPHIH